MEIGETVVFVSDLDGMPAGKEGMVMRVRDDMLLIGFRSAERLEFVLPDLGKSCRSANGGDSERESRSATRNNVNPMPNGEVKGVRPLTSVELLDAAVWREIGTQDPQPSSAFIEGLASLVARWLLVRSETPEMDAMTLICRARGYMSRARDMEDGWTP